MTIQRYWHFDYSPHSHVAINLLIESRITVLNFDRLSIYQSCIATTSKKHVVGICFLVRSRFKVRLGLYVSSVLVKITTDKSPRSAAAKDFQRFREPLQGSGRPRRRSASLERRKLATPG